MRALRWVIGGVPCAIGVGVLAYGCGDYIGLCDYNMCVAPDGGPDGAADAPHPDAGDGATRIDAGDAGDGAVQEEDAPFDAPVEAGVECDSAAALVCNGQCVDPTLPAHCGSCTNQCPGPASMMGQATCTTSADASETCGVSCSAGYHLCNNGDCLANSDEPSVTTDPCVLTEAFGVFAAPTGNDAAGCGTRAMPCATIGHAMDVAVGMTGIKRVYACGSAGSYTENLVVGTSQDGLSVYGGLDCSTNPSTWTYNASKLATVAPTAAGYALEVNGLATGVTFEDFSFAAKAGQNPGDSSIAVFVNGAQGVVLTRVSVTAGAGVASGTGTTGSNYTGATAPSGASPNGEAAAPAASHRAEIATHHRGATAGQA